MTNKEKGEKNNGMRQTVSEKHIEGDTERKGYRKRWRRRDGERVGERHI